MLFRAVAMQTYGYGCKYVQFVQTVLSDSPTMLSADSAKLRDVWGRTRPGKAKLSWSEDKVCRANWPTSWISIIDHWVFFLKGGGGEAQWDSAVEFCEMKRKWNALLMKALGNGNDQGTE